MDTITIILGMTWDRFIKKGILSFKETLQCAVETTDFLTEGVE